MNKFKGRIAKPMRIERTSEDEPKPVRITFGYGTFACTILGMIAREEGVTPNVVARAMVKSALVEWLKQSTQYPEFRQDVREHIKNDQLSY